MKIINKTGRLKGHNEGFKIALMEAISDSQSYDGKIYNNYDNVDYNYSYHNNGNSWLQTTISFRKTKKVWIVE